METVTCIYCGAQSQFDVEALRRGVRKPPAPSTPVPIVVQCPACKKWLTVEFADTDPPATP